MKFIAVVLAAFTVSVSAAPTDGLAILAKRSCGVSDIISCATNLGGTVASCAGVVVAPEDIFNDISCITSAIPAVKDVPTECGGCFSALGGDVGSVLSDL